jgi:hypothetical protein
LGGVTLVCAATVVAARVITTAIRLSNFMVLILTLFPFQEARRL